MEIVKLSGTVRDMTDDIVLAIVRGITSLIVQTYLHSALNYRHYNDTANA